MAGAREEEKHSEEQGFNAENSEEEGQRALRNLGAQAGVPVPHGGGLILELSEEVVEGFGQGRVCEDGVAERGVGEMAHHGDLELGRDFAAFEAEDGGAKDLVGGGVDDGFQEAAGFVDFQGASDVTHGHFGDADGAVLPASLRFGEADAAELRVDEDGVGNEAIRGGRGAIFEQVGAKDAEVVVGNVGEGRPAFDVAEGVDVFRGGFELFVDADEAAGVGGDGGGGKIQRVGVGDPSSGDEQVRAFDFARFSGGTKCHCDAISGAGDFFDLGVEMNLDVVFLKDACDGIGDVFVFTVEELRRALQNSDAAAKAAKELREFQAYVTAANNEKMRRNLGEFHDGGAVEVGHVSKARNFGDSRAASGVDQETVGGEGGPAALGCAHDDGFGAGEGSHAIDWGEIFGVGDAS